MSEKKPTTVLAPAPSVEELLLKDPTTLTPEEVDRLRAELLQRIMAPPVAIATGAQTPTAPGRPVLPAFLTEEVEWDMPLAAGGYVFNIGDTYYHGRCRAPRHVYNDLMRLLQENATIEAERLVNRGVVGRSAAEKDLSAGHRIPEARPVRAA
jgi:hypothetical protein